MEGPRGVPTPNRWSPATRDKDPGGEGRAAASLQAGLGARWPPGVGAFVQVPPTESGMRWRGRVLPGTLALGQLASTS